MRKIQQKHLKQTWQYMHVHIPAHTHIHTQTHKIDYYPAVRLAKWSVGLILWHQSLDEFPLYNSSNLKKKSILQTAKGLRDDLTLSSLTAEPGRAKFKDCLYSSHHSICDQHTYKKQHAPLRKHSKSNHPKMLTTFLFQTMIISKG